MGVPVPSKLGIGKGPALGCAQKSSKSEGETKRTKRRTYDGLTNYIKRNMDICFKKRRNNQDNWCPDTKIKNSLFLILKKHLKRGKAQRKVARVYIDYLHKKELEAVQRERSDKIRKRISQLEDENGRFCINNFWKIKKSAGKVVDDKSSVINREGVEVFNEEAIITEYENEFKHRLAHFKIDKSLETYEKRSHDLLKLLLQEAVKRKEPDFTIKELIDGIMTFKNGKSPGRDWFPAEILKNAGIELLEMILEVLNYIKNTLNIPSSWEDVLIKTLYKKKGSKKILENYRGIFLASVMYKLMEKLVKGRINKYLQYVNLFQGGSRKNRSPADNLFLIYGIRDHAAYLNSSVNYTFYDYKTCFDKVWLEDSMITLWNLGVRSELFALIYKLNSNSRINIKTPYGLSETINCPTIVKQGTVLGPDLCSASTAEASDEKKCGGFCVGEMITKLVTFVDDTMDINTNINDTISSHNQQVFFTKKKRQELNVKKCVIMMQNRRITDSVPTLMVEGSKIKEVSETMYLGDAQNNKGNNMSLVKDRSNKGNAVLINSVSMCNEITVGKYYLKSMLLVYKTVFIQVMLSNSRAWSNVNKSEMDVLKVSQLKFLKRMMKLPSSASNTAVYLELGLLPIDYEIHQRQLMFLHHIVNLTPEDPVRLMFEQQQLLPYEKNWGNTIKVLLERYGLLLNYEEIGNLKKQKWKQLVEEKVKDVAFSELLTANQQMSKTRELFYESFSQKQYITEKPADMANLIFRIRIKSVKCKANMKSSFSDLKCRLCDIADEDQEHVVNCPSVKGLGDEIDISNLREEEKDWSMNEETLQEVAKRIEKFNELLGQD
jgi:hypothetical protein